MTFNLKIGRRARRDLVAIHRWISDAADSQVADNYMQRLNQQMASLRDYPRRGTSRSGIRPGLRTVTFERTIIIAYLVNDTTVEILRILDARRDWPRLLPG